MRLLLSTGLLPAQGFGVSKLHLCYDRLLYTDPEPTWQDVLQQVYLVISMAVSSPALFQRDQTGRHVSVTRRKSDGRRSGM